jgi:hypothetical protein
MLTIRFTQAVALAILDKDGDIADPFATYDEGQEVVITDACIQPMTKLITLTFEDGKKATTLTDHMAFVSSDYHPANSRPVSLVKFTYCGWLWSWDKKIGLYTPERESGAIEASEFTLTLAEGPLRMVNKPVTCYTWFEASQQLIKWKYVLNPKQGEGYYKTDFRIKFADGCEYKGRIDITHGELPHLATHVQRHMKYRAEKGDKEAQAWLKHYLIGE